MDEKEQRYFPDCLVSKACFSSWRTFFLGPTSAEFQPKAKLEGQFVKPSWCLAVNTRYLRVIDSRLDLLGSCLSL